MASKWTQPVCYDCWCQRYGWEPNRLTQEMRVEEKCCHCGTATVSGIYVRIDPATVPHPAEEK